MTDEGMIAKILALLAKAESTEFEAERDTYMAKAQELMLKHSVEQSQLTPQQAEQMMMKECAESRNKYDQILLSAVCRSADVYHVIYAQAKRYGSAKSGGVTHGTLTGTQTDIRYVESLYASLLIQREIALKMSLHRGDKPEWEHGKSFNNSFRVNFAVAASAKMQEAKRTTVDSVPGMALVLVTKADKAMALARAQDPSIRSSSQKISNNSYAGATAGTTAGRNADTSGGRNHVANQRALNA